MMGKPPRHRNTPNAAAVAAAAAQQPRIVSSNSSTGSAPSSVMCVPASPLARELSDLSGSYMNGNTAPRSGGTNRSFSNSVCSGEEPVQGFWRQAHILSTPCPREPPPTGSTTTPPPTSSKSSASALIVVERNGVIELVKNSDVAGDDQDEQQQQADSNNSSLHEKEGSPKTGDNDDDLRFLSNTSSLLLQDNHTNRNLNDSNNHDESSTRIPILILLLDPGRKKYELMQLWVDPQTDLVRDVLHALQRKLSDKWRQDYDGLFQLRGNQYCQLVHILSIAKYDIRPRELWVAKPWSMAAKSTTDLANDCIRQLRAGGLLTMYTANNSPGSKSRMRNFFSKGSSNAGRTSPTMEDAPLTLSDEALKRMYVPDGTTILKHHHACQFLSFRVPSIPSRVVSGQRAHNSQQAGNKGFLGSLLGTSQSFDDVSSQLSNPSDAMLLPLAETPNKFDCSSTTSPSPGRRHRQQQQQQQSASFQQPQHRHPTAPANSKSKWHTSGPLEAVGEVVVSTAAKDTTNHHQHQTHQEPANVSTILADLETTKRSSELKQQQPPPPSMLRHNSSEEKKEHRCSLWALLAPLNCGKRRGGGSGKGDDGYSSSWGGDGSSKKTNGSNNNGSSDNNDDGRETPTSKGSGDGEEEPFTWRGNHGAGGGNNNNEDNSIVSDSAPLLSRMPETSSSCSQPLEQPQELPPLNAQPLIVRPTPFSRYAGKV